MRRLLLFLLVLITFVTTVSPVNAWWWWNSGPSISISPDGGSYYSTSSSKRITVTITVSDPDGIKNVYVYKDGAYFSYIDGKKCEWKRVQECDWERVRKCELKPLCKEEYVCGYQCWRERVCDEICDGWLHICWETNCRYEKKCGYRCGWKWVCENTYECWYEWEPVCKYRWEKDCHYKTRVSKTISFYLHEGETTLKVVAYDKYDERSTKTVTFKLIVSKLRVNYFNVPSSVYLSDRNSWNVKVSYKVSDGGCGIEYVKIYVDGKEKYSKSGKPFWCFWCSYDKKISDNPTISGSGAGWHSIKLVVKSACDGTKSTTKRLYVKKPKPSITYLTVNPKSAKGNEKYEANFCIHVKSKDPVGLDHYEIYDNGRHVKTVNIKAWSIFGWYYPHTDDKVIKITLKGVGTHTLRIYVYNKVGEYTVKTIRVTILDDAPPSITVSPPSRSFDVDEVVDVGNGEYYLAKRLSVKVTVKEDLKWKSYAIWLDGKKIGEDTWQWYYDWSPWADPHKIEWSKTVILLPGTHTLKVEVYDVHDHRSVKTVRYNVICRDSSAPKVTVSPGTVYTTTNGKNVKFTVKVEDNCGIAHVIVKLNGITIVDRKGKLGHVFEKSFTRNLPVGTHTIYVWTRDYAGLITEKSFTINVARTEPPSITLQVRNPYYTIADETAKVPVTIKVMDDKGVAKVQIYVDGKLRQEFNTCNGVCDGALHICTGCVKSFDKTLKLVLSIGKHTIKVIATDNTGAKSSKVTIVNVVHKEPEIKILYDPDVPYFVKEIPVRVYVNSPENGSVTIKVNGRLASDKKVEAFKPSEYPISLTDLPNKYNAKKTYKITITLKTDSTTKTYSETVTLQRTAEFKPGSEFTFKVRVDKGYGHTRVWIEYDGRKITPSQPMPELNAWERKIVDVPFKITAKKSGFVKVVAENEAGRDEKTLYLQVGNVQTPTVTPTPTPTPTPIPTPTPTVPASYEACYVQVNGGGANKDDSGGIGYAEAWVAGNEIHVLARQEGGGLRPSVAEGYVYSDFKYDVPTHNAKVTVKYYVSGSMFVIGVGGVGETSYYVKVELIDLTTGKTLGVKEHGDSYSLNVIDLKQKVIDETITDTFNVKLIKGHEYRVKIYAKVTAESLGFGGTTSDFAEWDFSGKTRLIKFESVCLKWT